MRAPGAFLTFVCGLLCLPAGAQPYLLKDISPGMFRFDGLDFENMRPYRMTIRLGNEALFGGYELADGEELWRTDGTEAGTFQVRDIQTTVDDKYGGSVPAYLTSFQGKAYFTAAGGATRGLVSVRSLYRTDGTAAGTSFVAAPTFTSLQDSGFSSLAATAYRLVLINGNQIWSSDGTGAGTSLLRDLGAEKRILRFQELLPAGSRVVFGAYFAAAREVWGTDGTPAGTAVVASFDPYAYLRIYRLEEGGFAVFSVQSSGDSLSGLWRTDGTAEGTFRLKDLGGRSPAGAARLGNQVLFDLGSELWITDGSVTGTRLVKAVTVSKLGVAGDTGYFAGPSGELWTTDGTEAGTIRVGAALVASDQFLKVGTKTFFAGSDAAAGNELWMTDGTDAGTRRVRDIKPGSAGSDPVFIAGLNGGLVFTADDAVDGYQLWFSDGTEAGTRLLKMVGVGGSGSNPTSLTSVDGKLFFLTSQTSSGFPLWVSDGTGAGTTLVRTFSSGFDYLVAGGSRLFFAVGNGFWYDLWSSDGTADGTHMALSDVYCRVPFADGVLCLGLPRGSPPWNELWRVNGVDTPVRLGSLTGSTVEVSGKVFFPNSTPQTGEELWVSDGTPAGTRLVADLAPGAADSKLRSLTPGLKRLYFVTFISGRWQLWFLSSHGGPPVAVKEFDDEPVRLAYVNDSVFFITGTFPAYSFWRSDGTDSGTIILGGSSAFSTIAPTANAAFFSTSSPAPGLWSATESSKVATFLYPVYPEVAVPLGNLLIFIGHDTLHGSELWRSDGTPSGTGLLADILPGPESSGILSMRVLEGRLYFSATDGEHGRELWSTDGTVQGTTRLTDLNPGAGSSILDVPFALAGERIFCVADDGLHGAEVWAVPRRIELCCGDERADGVPVKR